MTEAVRAVETAENAEGVIPALQRYFLTLPDDAKKLARHRVAVLIEIAGKREALVPILTEQRIADIEDGCDRFRRRFGRSTFFCWAEAVWSTICRRTRESAMR